MTVTPVLSPISGIDRPAISLNAATGIGAGSVVNFSWPRRNISMQVVYTSNPSPVKVTLEGTIDGTDWFILATFDTGAASVNKDIVYADNVTVLSARANLVTLTGGTTPAVTASIFSSP